MAATVVDASAIAALLFGETEADEVRQRLGDNQLFAPPLLNFELANVCWLKGRKNPALRESLAEAFRLRSLLGIEEVHVDYDAVLALATQTGLTAYDGAYLWLTRHLGAELVTRDRGLAAVSAA